MNLQGCASQAIPMSIKELYEAQFAVKKSLEEFKMPRIEFQNLHELKKNKRIDLKSLHAKQQAKRLKRSKTLGPGSYFKTEKFSRKKQIEHVQNLIKESKRHPFFGRESKPLQSKPEKNRIPGPGAYYPQKAIESLHTSIKANDFQGKIVPYRMLPDQSSQAFAVRNFPGIGNYRPEVLTTMSLIKQFKSKSKCPLSKWPQKSANDWVEHHRSQEALAKNNNKRHQRQMTEVSPCKYKVTYQDKGLFCQIVKNFPRKKLTKDSVEERKRKDKQNNERLKAKAKKELLPGPGQYLSLRDWKALASSKDQSTTGENFVTKGRVKSVYHG